MSKREGISRYNLIIKKLRKKPATFREISDYLKLESEIQSHNFDVSKRTFQRDVDDIRSIYNIDIRFDFSRQVYFIDDNDQPDVSERILEAFDTFNALNISDRMHDFIQFEPRRPQGTEHLYGLLHAIKNQLQVRFAYHKFWDEAASSRTVQPLMLKEVQNRWYVLARDVKDGRDKTFALDRVSELQITTDKFLLQPGLLPGEKFRDCFGIISPGNEEPCDVILSFTPLQGKYIKTLPLHHSQQILVDNDEETRVKLHLYVTFDLVQEIMSHGDNVTVREPSSLRDEIKAKANDLLSLYQ